MPIIGSTALDRKNHFITVWEAFGCYPDISIYRCRVKSPDKAITAHGVTCESQCTAEFCYEFDPHTNLTSEERNRYRDRIPVDKCINIKFENDRAASLNIQCEIDERVRDDAVYCKLCGESVGHLKNNRINFYFCERWKVEVDTDFGYDRLSSIPETFLQIIRQERNRARNIPFNIRQYKLDNNIPDDIVKKKKRVYPTNPNRIVKRA